MRFLFFLAMAPVTTIWYGFALSVMWGWFVVPAFHVAPLRIPFAIGVAYIIQFLTHQTNREENEPEIGRVLVLALVRPLTLLLVGWIVKQFI